MRVDARRGFTVLELTVALAVAGIVMFTAWSMVDQVARASAGIASYSNQSDREANADRLLRSLLSQIIAPADSLSVFAGAPDVMRFVTRCEQPGGWQEACEAGLALTHMDGQLKLHAVFPDRIVELHAYSGRASFRYLESPAHGGRWLPSWKSALSIPWAIGVVTDRDTAIVRIGERG